MAADKLKPALVWPENKTFSHWSDCAVHNAPAYPAGKCDCGVAQEPVGTLNISRYKGHLVNYDFDYFGELPDGTYSVYTTPPLPVQPAQEPDMLTIAYQSGYFDGKKAALAGREWNFCERCGKRTADLTTIHTCTPPQEGT
jgi:hypothetical protein